MTPNSTTPPERDDVEDLLPWFASDRLGREDRARVEAALQGNAELTRRVALAEEERGETVRLNEALGGPSARAMADLFGRIDAEPARRTGLWRRMVERWSAASPRSFAWGACAAALVIVVQAGVIVEGLTHRAGQATYETASGPSAPFGAGSFALVGFAPEATAAEITSVMARYKASIVDGPRAGLYRVRLDGEKLSPDAVAAMLDRLRSEAGVIRFASPAAD